MSGPKTYAPEYSFSGFQASSPTTPLPAAKVDNELANVAEASASQAAAINDVRRSDGALQNGIVTYDSLEPALQFLVDPTNAQAVAAAVATAQAAATAASGSATTAAGSATSAANSAAAAAASASGVNLALYLSKAGNLAGMGNVDTARGNISAMKVDASDAVGRLAPVAGHNVTDWNNVTDNGYYSSAAGATNAPDSTNDWLVHVQTGFAGYTTQIAYTFAASAATDAVQRYRRHSYNSGGGVAWTPWISDSGVAVGSVIFVPFKSPPPGYLKLNGALISRAIYSALWTAANASGNIVSEASWSGGYSGAFSTGDLSTTFRLPDGRGEFFRGWDDSRGVDSGRVISQTQADLIKDHTHSNVYNSLNTYNSPGGATNVVQQVNNGNTGGVNGGLGGAETRPRNIALLACIKF